MEIREPTTDDIKEIVEMAYEFELHLLEIDDSLIQEPPSRQVFEDYLRMGFDDPKHQIIVAEEDGGLIGFADLWVYPEFLHGGISAYMHNIFVREGHRGSGVGKALLDSIVVEAAERGAVALHVPVKSKNVKAIEFYRKNGIDEQLAMMETRLDR